MISRRELLTSRLRLDPGTPDALAAFGTASRPGPRAKYFPNVLVQTHEGKSVRFYDDLIRGRIVAPCSMWQRSPTTAPSWTVTPSLIVVWWQIVQLFR